MEERKVWSIPEAGWTPSEAAKADGDALERLPDLEVASRGAATASYFEWPGRATVVLPVSINGQPMRFGMDTGAGMCIITEALAKRLGLRISPGQPLYDGMAGTLSTAGHYAVADRLRIGNTEFRNVSFLVLPDELDVLREIPTDERGAIGLPVLLGLQTIRWNRSHRLDIGFTPARASVRAANLAFENLFPLVAVEVAGRRLSFEFDTGAATLDATILPELRMRVARFPIVVKEASTLLTPTIPASNLHYGLFAMDALSRAGEVTLDFRAMRLDLR